MTLPGWPQNIFSGPPSLISLNKVADKPSTSVSSPFSTLHERKRNMDEINSQFGRLSTSAAEWKPAAAAAAAATRSVSQQPLPQRPLPGGEGGHDRAASGDGGSSDLRASAVKEFVPGQGWSSVPPIAGSTAAASSSSSKGENEIYRSDEPSYEIMSLYLILYSLCINPFFSLAFH